MKITLIQTDIVWGNPQANCKVAEQTIKSAPKSDVYVLPEMWTTGFATEPEGIAESDNCDSLKCMMRWADTFDAAIAGSITVKDSSDGICRNRFYFVRPGGIVEHYDKHHLFTMGGECKHYKAGDKRTIVEWRGVRFLLQICYDLRFPVWARNHEDYDAAIYVASWPEPRVGMWKILLHARAVENQCYVIGVNRVGNDPSCKYSGGTMFVNPYGVAEQCPDNEVCSITCELDMEQLNEYRTKFPVLKDRD